MRERGEEERRKKEAGHGQLSLRFFLPFAGCCVLFCFVVTKVAHTISYSLSFHATDVNQLLRGGVYAKQEVNKYIYISLLRYYKGFYKLLVK